MNFKKTFIKSAAFALALGFIGFLSPQVTKAATAAATATFDGVEEKITTTGNKFWGIAKEVDEKKKDFSAGGKFYKVDEVLPIENNTIDLSFLNQGKQNILAIGQQEAFDDTKWAVKIIEPQNKNFKAGFLKIEGGNVTLGTVTIPEGQTLKDDELGAFAAANGDAIVNVGGADAAKVEVKVGKIGRWIPANTFFGSGDNAKATIKRLIQGGTEVTARYVGVKEASGVIGAWASKEVKFKFPKQGKAPKVVVDTAKSEIKLKKGQEYKLYDTDAPSAWTPSEGKKTFAELSIDLTKDLTLEVRDAATAKKPASKITVIKLTKQTAPTVQALTTTGALITGVLNLDMKLPYDIKKGATIINSSKNEYEYAITADGKTPAADHKWLKIKPGKDDKKNPVKTIPSKTSVKYLKDASKGNGYGDTNTTAKIYVRLAGTKQDKNDGSAKLPSPAGDAKFIIANEDRSLTLDGFEVAAKVKTEKIHTASLEIDKLHKKGSKPKVKILDKVPGVSVKIGNFKDLVAPVTVKVSKSAFKDVPSPSPTLKFKVFHEGAEKEVSVTFAITK